MESAVAAGRTAVVFLCLAVGSLVAVVLVVAGFAVLAVGVHWLVFALADVVAWLGPGTYEDADLILPLV